MSVSEINLGDLVKIRTGKLDANAAVEGGKYPFFTCAREISWIDTPAFDADALLVAGNGDLNVKHYVGKFNAYQRTYVIENGAPDHLDMRYLYYFMDRYLETLRRQSIGGVIKYIKLGNLTDAPVPFLPLEEQRRIAAILDKADAIRRKREEALKLTDTFLKSVFLEMFGDPAVNPKGWDVGHIRDLVSEVKYGSSQKASAVHGRVPILRMGNLTYGGTIDITDLKFIDLSEGDKDKYTVRRGDLLFNRTNSRELVGKTAVFELEEVFAFAGYLIRARVNERASPYYISAFLNSDFGKLTLKSMCKNIIGMANINAQELQDIRIPIPSVELQDRFAGIVQKTGYLRGRYKDAIELAEHLFSSLSQRAFRGEL